MYPPTSLVLVVKQLVYIYMTHAITQPASSTGQIKYTVHIKGGNY